MKANNATGKIMEQFYVPDVKKKRRKTVRFKEKETLLIFDQHLDIDSCGT